MPHNSLPDPAAKPVLIHNLTEEEEAFFQAETGIHDKAALRAHILEVQRQELEIVQYPCIIALRFLMLKTSNHPAYQSLLKLGATREGAIFLDMGCCFGTDVRKAVRDGFPARQIIASDLLPVFWSLGHRLFETDPASFPIKFIPQDIFDLSVSSPAQTSSSKIIYPSVDTISSLESLKHQISAINTSAFYHLFNEEQQLAVAKRLASLLSPEPGSMMFGWHRGATVKGLYEDVTGHMQDGMFRHCPESWTQMWEEEVFGKGTVKCEIYPQQEEHFQLIWSVTRL